jgi:hypothetical protein
MKKFGTLAITLALAGITFVSLQGCKPKGPPPSKIKSLGIDSAETTSFKEVTSKLDEGGSFYLYLSTEAWLKDLSGKVDKWRVMADSVPDLQDKRDAVNNAFNIGTRLIKDSGLEDISGLGMSSIAREPGMYYNKMIVHHYSGQGNGFIWTMFGKDPHELEGLNLLPVNTAMAAFYDLDAAQIWSVIQTQCEKSGFPEAKDFLKTFPEQFQKGAGMKWEDAIGSLGGEFGVVMTLDDSRMVRVPLPGQQALQVPEPGLMFVIKVKNDAIFNRIDAALKQTKVPGLVNVEKDGMKMRTVPVPLPLPITLRPSVATSGGYLFIATTDALIQEALAVKGGKAGLKSTDEFKKLSADIPQQGNQFMYVSKRFGQTFMKIQQQTMGANGQLPPQMKELMNSFIQPDKAGFTYAVGVNSDEGWLTVANGSQSSGNAVVVAPAVFVGLLAGIAVPNFVKARDVSQKNVCINNLRMIDAAKAQWALEKNKSQGADVKWEDIQPFLGRGRATMRCPNGGEYTVGAVGESPTCSIPGHALP